MSPSRAANPGTLVLVVGPSGAGKDTLIAIAQDLVGGPMIVFPRRIVTRDPSAAEANQGMPAADFDRAVGEGAFAFWWEAHGLKYGLPAAVDHDMVAGRSVVCNVSRAIVPRLRQRYARCEVVLVDAPREVRAARIQRRARASDGEIAARLDRNVPNQDSLVPDLVIENVGDPCRGGRLLADMLLRTSARPGPVRERPSAKSRG
jgi:ribose 1,5-bisphosphokinase